jgi:acyl-[acyl-carrier-protein]-phospholipid O-acyltransferase/long-chain-fatty-acid--[acyl-carrier-protein] ligase
VGAVLVSEFAPLVSGTLAAKQEVATIFLIVFSLAVAAGAMVVNMLQKGEVSARYVPVSVLGLALGLLWLWWGATGFQAQVAGASLAQFMATPGLMPFSPHWA